MREFIFYSAKARTSGNIKDMMAAGRIDIVCHSIISAFFLSHKTRNDVKLHMVFDGPPDPPKHLEIASSEEMKDFISKKDILGLIKRMLYKYRKGRRVEVFPSCFIEKKSFEDLVSELAEKKDVFLLDWKGESVEDIPEEQIRNAVFVLGDDDGIPKKKIKLIKKIIASKISLGPENYFSSQAIVILQNLLDRRK